MSDPLYEQIIGNMVWSYSRITTYEDCPYRWFLKYICEERGSPRFYSSYGQFLHNILADYYSGKEQKEDLVARFLTNFSKEVVGSRPSSSVVRNYIDSGTNYLRWFTPIPYEVIGVEVPIDFMIMGHKFTCRIDYVGKDKDGICLVDHKSRGIKQKSNRETPTQNDIDVDKMMRQLYIYSAAIKSKYGEFPKKLALNSFKTGELVEEPFDKAKFDMYLDWADTTIKKIIKSSDYSPRIDYFPCRYICDVSECCCYKDCK